MFLVSQILKLTILVRVYSFRMGHSTKMDVNILQGDNMCEMVLYSKSQSYIPKVGTQFKLQSTNLLACMLDFS